MNKYLYALLLSLFIFIPSVKAESYYSNNNGVELTEKQYNYISELFYDGYQDTMTIDEVEKMERLNLFNQPIESKDSNDIIDSAIVPRGSSLTNGGRTLKISKSCSTECLVTLKATWSLIPNVYSYDVIGFRLTSGTITQMNKATVRGNGYTADYPASYAQQSGNGYGHSVQISNVSNLVVATSMYATTGGTAYGSYQHAMSNISLANSKLYTIGAGGYGYVFNFYGAAVGVYDGIGGVDKSL